MRIRGSGYRHCSNCGVEIVEPVEACPSCEFNPKASGLKIAAYALLSVPLLWIAGMIIVFFDPVIGGMLMVAGMILFLVCTVLYLLAMAARPYRLGGLFRRIPL